VTYNLLAPCYVRVPNQFWNAYTHCRDEWLDWESRRERLLATLLRTEADVLCLQEVVFEEREGEWVLPQWLAPMQAAGFTAIIPQLKPKEWESQASRNERVLGHRVTTGLAVLVKGSKLSLSRPTITASRALTCFLEDKNSPTNEFAIVTVHLEGNPEMSDKQVDQMRSALKKLPKDVSHVILCGDFNTECLPESPLATLLATHGPVALQRAPTGATWADPTTALRLDHLLYSDGLELLAVLDGMTPDLRASGLPTAECPSDHLPIGAVLRPRTHA
jgi:endonuclease/exonuclease/phosphatase family metal-dependent hydrolase